MFWKKSKWSDNPGCFERHLQRRDGNLLFPEDRRAVSSEEIKQARKKDKECRDIYIKKVSTFIKRFYQDENDELSHFSNTVQEIQSLIEEGASVGGDVWGSIGVLENLEETLIEGLNEAVPEGKPLLEKTRSLSFMERIDFFAHKKREDSPILETEELPTILSENLDTIAMVGYLSRNFPDFRPSEEDVKKLLDEAISQGFDPKKANQIISTWNEKQ